MKWIPDGATNGEVFKFIFPCAIESDYIEHDLNMQICIVVYLGDYEMRVSYDWWHAPYDNQEGLKTILNSVYGYKESEKEKQKPILDQKVRKKYRKKPVIVEAYQTDKEMIIHTLEGDMKASIGDYIIKGINGEIISYELVESENNNEN